MARLIRWSPLLVAVLIIGGCRQVTPPQDVTKMGFALLIESLDEPLTGTATFARQSQPIVQPIPAPFAGLAAVCSVSTSGTIPTEPTPTQPAPSGTPVSAGARLSVRSAGSELTAFTPVALGNYEIAVADQATGPLPAGAVTLDTPGSSFARFTAAAFPATEALAFTSPAQVDDVTSSTSFAWNASAPDTSVIIVIGADGDVIFNCVLPDDGTAALPDDTVQELDEAGFTVGELLAAARMTVSASVENDSLLLLGTLRFADLGEPLPGAMEHYLRATANHLFSAVVELQSAPVQPGAPWEEPTDPPQPPAEPDEPEQPEPDEPQHPTPAPPVTPTPPPAPPSPPAPPTPPAPTPPAPPAPAPSPPAPPAPTPPATDWWQPSPGTSWQWQLTGKIDTSLDVDMFDIDLFDSSKATIQAIQANGAKVICYFSAGSFEPWRPDANQFPSSVKGDKMDGWDELWLDIRQLDVLRGIMGARLDIAVSKGCDGVEPDNVDGYSNRTGFPLKGADQIAYNRMLATEAHARGLAIALKNDLDQVKALEPYFDFAINEECHAWDECDMLLPFIQAGKAVFGAEYDLSTSQFCSEANALNMDFIRKRLSLDAYREACR